MSLSPDRRPAITELEQQSAPSLNLEITFPFNHRSDGEKLRLRLINQQGAIGYSTFQSEVSDFFVPHTKYLQTGLGIFFNRVQRLILCCDEYPMHSKTTDGQPRTASHLYLMKTNPEDQKILVTPILGKHRNQPYVLRNNHNYNAGKGLLIDVPELKIEQQNGKILVTRVWQDLSISP